MEELGTGVTCQILVTPLLFLCNIYLEGITIFFHESTEKCSSCPPKSFRQHF